MLDLHSLLQLLSLERTLDDVWTWWAQTYLQQLANAPTVRRRMEGHVLPALGQLGHTQLTPATIERRLNALSARLAPATLNAIRSHLSRVIDDAQGEGLWRGPNPCDRVRVRRVPQRAWPTLSPLEAQALLSDGGPYRNAFALALYLGLRKNEIFGLRVLDVDVARRILRLEVTNGRDTTKNGRARILPVTPELWPYVEDQVGRARDGLLFPRCSGGPHRRDEKLAARLRSAFKRVGIVDGYWSICRWCSTRNSVISDCPARCAACDRKLWLEPIPRALRAHDLRHSFTTLSSEAGVDRDVYRYVMGHAGDVTSIYLHLHVERVRVELTKLTLKRGTT